MSPSNDPDPGFKSQETRHQPGVPEAVFPLQQTREYGTDGQQQVGFSTARADQAATPQPLELPPRYSFRGWLGGGGMGEVVCAFDTELKRLVAIKFMRTPATLSTRRRFVEESNILAQLKHPNVVVVHDRGEVEGRPYFVMDHLAGASLAERREEFRTSAARAVAVIVGVAAGVRHAHEHGVFHRDLKGSNVMFHQGNPVVVDFGCARWDDGDFSTVGFAHIGTPSHMAPEVLAHGSKAHDARADLWSLGVMLYFLLAGELPFTADPRTPEGREKQLTTGPTPVRECRKAVPGVNDALQAIISKALSPLPDDRYQTVAEFADALNTWAGAIPESVRPGVWPRTTAPRRKRAMLAAVVASLVLSGVSVAAVALWPRKDTPPTTPEVKVESVAERLKEPGDSVTFIAASGLPREQVGPLGEFVGSVSTNADGRCELGAAKMYFHELFRGPFPFRVRIEADVSVCTPDKPTVAGLYAGEKRHPYPPGGTIHIAYLNAIRMGDADTNNPTLPKNRKVGSDAAKFRPPVGGPTANALTQLVLLGAGWKAVPPDPIDPHGRPGPWHQLAIEVDEQGRWSGSWDGLPSGHTYDPAGKLLESVLAQEMQFHSAPLGDGYGVFVRDGSAQFANVRVSRPKP